MQEGRDLYFYFPQAIYLLLFLLPLFVGYFALKHYRQRQLHAYASLSVLAYLLTPRSSRLSKLKLIGWMIIWTTACLALMGPFGNIRYLSLNSETPAEHVNMHATPHEVIFLVDTSASMGVPDGPEKETRLEEAKAFMEDIVRQLRGQTVSLYAFTSELSAVVPATLDYLFVRLALKELHIDEGDVGGTRFAPVLTALRQQAFPEPSLKRYTVILFSDGGDTQLATLKGEARNQEKQAILTAIPHPDQLHLRLFTIGLGALQPQVIPHVTFEGKPVSSQLEPAILEELAAKERGVYYMAQKWTSWNLAQELITQMGQDPPIEHGELERRVAPIKQEDVLVDLYYQIPLSLALLFYFFNLLLPDVRRS
jgi:Ca-activated chloride channel family protein